MRRFRTLRVQLLLTHLVLVVLMALVIASSIGSFFSLGRSIDRVLQGTFPSVLACERMKDSLQRQQQSLTLVVTGRFDLARSDYRQSTIDLRAALGDLENASGPDTADAVRELGDAETRYEAQVSSFVREVPRMSESQLRDAYLSQIRPSMAGLLARVELIQRFDQSAIRKANMVAREEAQGAAIRSLWQTAIALGLAILLAFRMIRVALTPLEHLTNHAQAIGEGDLDRRIDLKRSDEIGTLAKAFNAMAESLAEARATTTRRLKRAEQMSDAALESLYDPIVVSDARGRLVYLNKAAQGLFGPTPITPRMPIIEHIGDRRIVRAIQHAIREDRVSAGEDPTTLIPLTVEGAHRTYRLRATPMKDAQGQMLGSVTVLEDITHLKDIDRIKSEFIGVASHELRTPVTSLLLSVQLLEEGAAGALTLDQEQIVAVQRQDLERLDRLMRELLDISRLEAGTAPPRFELVLPGEMLEAALQSTKAEANQKGVGIEITKDPAGQQIRADKSQIGRVLVNLITNAIRHTPTGGRITLAASSGPDQVTFSVEDTGSGIPKEYLENIFDRFVQVPGATGGGAGLGLSISRSIVQAHGGEMSVRSAPGKGSTFSFTVRTDRRPNDQEEEV